MGKALQHLVALVIGIVAAAILVVMLGAFGITWESVTAAVGK